MIPNRTRLHEPPAADVDGLKNQLRDARQDARLAIQRLDDLEDELRSKKERVAQLTNELRTLDARLREVTAERDRLREIHGGAPHRCDDRRDLLLSEQARAALEERLHRLQEANMAADRRPR